MPCTSPVHAVTSVNMTSVKHDLTAITIYLPSVSLEIKKLHSRGRIHENLLWVKSFWGEYKLISLKLENKKKLVGKVEKLVDCKSIQQRNFRPVCASPLWKWVSQPGTRGRVTVAQPIIAFVLNGKCSVYRSPDRTTDSWFLYIPFQSTCILDIGIWRQSKQIYVLETICPAFKKNVSWIRAQVIKDNYWAHYVFVHEMVLQVGLDFFRLLYWLATFLSHLFTCSGSSEFSFIWFRARYHTWFI